MSTTSRPRSGQTAAVTSRSQPPRNPPAAEPIYLTSAFQFPDIEAVLEAHDAGSGYFFYSRQSNPNQVTLEAAVSALDGAQAAASTSAGMAAISAACLACGRGGAHIVASHQLYGGTYELLRSVLPTLGIEADFVDASRPAAVRAAMRPTTRAIYVETISNPTMRVLDLPALAEVAGDPSQPPFLVVDNTFATPYGCRPLEHGASLSIHSLSKYMGGHNDLIGGIVAGEPSLIEEVRRLTRVFGWAISPFNAWLAVRGIRTLWLRMQQAYRNAMIIADFLSRHPAVDAVHYPGLPDHPDHAVAGRVLRGGFGGMLAFELGGGLGAVSRFVRTLHLVRFTPTLGGVATTISHPATTSHRQLSPEERVQVGITDGLIRLSTGIEDPQEITGDLAAALDAAGKSTPARERTRPG